MSDAPHTFRVRTATPADTAGVDALLARSYPAQLKADYPPSVMVTALPIISRARPELLACGTYYVAEAPSGGIVGAGGWTPRPGERGAADIRHVVTDHRHLRQGIGRAIFQTIFSESAAAGIAAFDCLSTLTAVPFYSAMGFLELGPVTIRLRQGIDFPAVRMRRS
ncbi:GNAT family N-acetyltransferase [Tropicimonas sp. IMCC6043]|uniref:GNAT family N-acetyltransferase n=1 Tax=Tropicimonas sp. IMCC6043 TaxID=2510645 RepID=UPI00101B84DD|nr:GNAT family N-acetyltransferase [Tropicimonas sp. IMCC6043]RYH11828.1 N-acetyltransferase [Tropicimonas sp. IMCC6043]